MSITCLLPYWKVQLQFLEENAIFGCFSPPSHCFDSRKWWSTFSWDESCFTLFTCPKWVDSPQVEEIVHIGLQGYFQFRFLYTSKRSANFEDFHTWKCMQISKPGKNNLCKELSHLMVLLTTETTGTIQKLQISKKNTVFTNNWVMWELWHFTWGIILTSDKFSGVFSCTTFSLSAVIWGNAHFMFILQHKSSHKMQAAQNQILIRLL